MTADEEDDYYVAQANEPLDEEGHFINKKVNVRYREGFQEIEASRAEYRCPRCTDRGCPSQKNHLPFGNCFIGKLRLLILLKAVNR